LRVKLEPATINLGTPYLHAGIACNKFGFIIGDASGGPEIVHIEEALGYLDSEDDEE
jgi:translation initiation factor 6 (eIF-6)